MWWLEVKNNVNISNMVVKSTKIEILQADASNTVIIHVELFSNEFNKYKCENKYLIGIELSNLDKILIKEFRGSTSIF